MEYTMSDTVRTLFKGGTIVTMDAKVSNLAAVDDLFAYIDVVAEQLGVHYRPIDMYVSTKLTAVASLDAGITTIIDACRSSRSPEHSDAALESLDSTGIRALHMV